MNVPKLRFKEFDGEWEACKLGSVTNSFSGGTPSVGNSSYYHGDVPFIRSGEINSEKTELFLTEEGLNNSSAKIVEVGDILYALYGATSGEVSISKIHGAINQAILAIKPIKGYSSQFIMQWLKLQKKKVIGKYLQGGQGNLSGSIVKDLLVKFPNFEEQQKNGEFFEKLDKKIQLQQQKIDLLQEQKKGYMQKIFKKELSFSDKSGQRYQTWVKKSLKEVADSITYGMNASAKAYDGENIYLRITDIDEESRSFIEKGKVSPSGELSEKYLLKEDDILFTRTGASTGKSFIFKNDSRKFYFAGFLIRVRIKEIYNSEFIYQQTLTYSYNKWVKIMSMRSGQPGINGEEFGTLEINVPCMEEQKKISNFLALLDKRIKLQKEKVELLKIQKQGFMQQMFI